ncbi:unnamed protein product [Brugia timori]|uniref:Uncharacterized protein n=1 Tax=Brugia timori TaxID=42155 RepID=A0A0R3QZU8_9BILA|nr:unnamed protein product [Brugia timori]
MIHCTINFYKSKLNQFIHTCPLFNLAKIKCHNNSNK